MVAKDHRYGLTAEQLKSQLRYEPDSGKFFAFEKINQRGTDTEAGWFNRFGYRLIVVFGRKYMAHRLAWLYMTGTWPKSTIDHKDGNKSDNRWTNLREATSSQNAVNRKTNINNKLGIKGVTFHRSGRYQARLGIGNSRSRHLGMYDTAEEAAAVYAKAALERNGEFTRLA
jgi:hypothetical protein